MAWGSGSGSYWQDVQAAGLDVPADRPLDELTADLTGMLGDPDPAVREGIAVPTLLAWVERGVYDDLLVGLGDGMAAGLSVGLGHEGDDTVFRRSHSSVVLAACIERDNGRPLVPAGKVLEWGDRIATWLLRERDLRGPVPGHGSARALARAADALAVLSRSPHVSRPELTVLLDVVADRVLAPTADALDAESADRLAATTLAVLRRDVLPLPVLEPWVARLAAGARTGGEEDRSAENAVAFLRSLYVRLSLAQRQPSVRADLLLVVIEAIRTLQPDL